MNFSLWSTGKFMVGLEEMWAWCQVTMTQQQTTQTLSCSVNPCKNHLQSLRLPLGGKLIPQVVKTEDNAQILACFFHFFLCLSYPIPVTLLPKRAKKVRNMNPKFLEALEVRDSFVCSISHGRAAFSVLSINSVCGLTEVTESPDFST